jgi:hypothetical protein
MTDHLLLWGRQKDAQPIIFDATRARDIRGNYGLRFRNIARRNLCACAPGDFAIHSHDCTDGPTRSNDDGYGFSTQQVGCLHRVHGQGLRPLHGERLLQHRGRELRLQSTECSWSAVGMRGNRHMQEIDAFRSELAQAARVGEAERDALSRSVTAWHRLRIKGAR